MNKFEERLDEALRAKAPVPGPTGGGGVDPERFLQFMNALVASADLKKTERALAKILVMDPAQLATLIARTQAHDDLIALGNYIKAKPSRMLTLHKIAAMLFPDVQVEAVLDEMMRDSSEERDDEGFYHDEGDGGGEC